MYSVPSVRQRVKPPGLLRQIVGLVASRLKSPTPITDVLPFAGDRGWFPIIREPFAGAWQRNQEVRAQSILSFSAIFACVTLIASDVAKIGLRLVEQDKDGIWNPIDVSAFSPVLRKPNRYQNRIKFIEQWISSKLIHGNTYIMKERDDRNVVVALYVLDPLRTRPLVAPDGSVFYQLSADNLSGIDENTVSVPASEIIHDTMVCLYHPLCGVSPITACGLAAIQGLAIQNNSTRLFQNGARPGGIVTAPGDIDDIKAKELKDYWEQNFTGTNAGRIAVLGGGLTFTPHIMSSVDAQLIEQLKWSAETVCSTFHVPPYMIGVGAPPNYNNIQALNQQYYSQCLQSIIENIELCLDDGLGLTQIGGRTYGTEFDLDDLLRMDSKTLAETEKDLKGIKSPNESRKRLNLKPVKGGEAPLAQQQDFSLAALAKRDAKDDPFASAKPVGNEPPALPPPPAKQEGEIDDIDIAAISALAAWEMKSQLAMAA